MFVRRGPAVMLSLVLSAAALSAAPGAFARDGGTATDVQKDRDPCWNATSTRAKLKVGTIDGNDSRLMVVGIVWSDDSDMWEWKLKHNGQVSDEGRSRGNEDTNRAFQVSRTMLNFIGTDDVVFRAENVRTGEVCRTYVDY